jgi:GT2 family glycosyltransferase
VSSVSAIVLAYLDEPWLERSVDALLASQGVEVEIVVVDNGCTDGAVDRLEGKPGVTILRPGTNLGFAGGCNAGVAAAHGEFVSLVNGDAIVSPDALARLALVAARPEVGIATASIRLEGHPELLNSGGNEVHFLGFSWVGRFGELAEQHPYQRDVTAASAAGLLLRRAVWDELGGFWEEYFAYYEDTDLSLRCWRVGLRVVYVPDAIVVHRYEFSRNRAKPYLLERNRLIMILTGYQTRTLALLAGPLVAVELATLGYAVRRGWWRAKFQAWAWLIEHRQAVAKRRRKLQAERKIDDRRLSWLLTDRLDPPQLPLPAALRPFNAVLASYWRLVRRMV